MNQIKIAHSLTLSPVTTQTQDHHDLRGERNISRNDQIPRCRTPDDFVVRDVETGSHLQDAQTRRSRDGERVISNQRHGDTGAVPGPGKDFLITFGQASASTQMPAVDTLAPTCRSFRALMAAACSRGGNSFKG